MTKSTVNSERPLASPDEPSERPIASPDESPPTLSDGPSEHPPASSDERPPELSDGHPLAKAVEALKAGRAVVFPTDTVYGLGVAVRHAASLQEIYQLKRRAAGKPVAWLIASRDDLLRYGANVPQQALELTEREWPGPLTVVVEASKDVPAAFRAPDGTIALRMPAHGTALALIAEAGPLATSSANLSGGDAVGCAAELDPELVERVACVVQDPLESQHAPSGAASAVIDFTGPEPVILRASRPTSR